MATPPPPPTSRSRSPSPPSVQPQAQHDEPQSQPPTSPPNPPNPSTQPTILIPLHHGPKTHHLSLPLTATLSDLSLHISETFSIPESNQKFLLSPKPGLLKPPFRSGKNAEVGLGGFALAAEAEEGRDANSKTRSKTKTKITLLGSTPSQIAALNAFISSSSSSSPSSRRPGQPTTTNNPKIKPAKPTRTTPSHPTASPSSNPYTFHTITPLPYLPHPSRSLEFLQRLSRDPGILTTMTTHKFSVSLLTEMDPAAHTTASHEGVGRTLGLNRNAGEVIELRLRTDAGDGYRDYKTIRRTLCHELTHNVFGEHDRSFWELCGRVEREVEAGGWWGRDGGRRVDESERWIPQGGEEGGGGEVIHDHGAWTGGEYVLGRGRSGQGGGSGADTQEGVLSRREILARAADERLRRERAANTGRPAESEHDERRDEDRGRARGT